MTHLFDSDWVIDYLVGIVEAHDLMASLNPGDATISIITFSEIYEGLYTGRDPRRAEAGFRSFLRDVTVLAVSRTVAKRNARLRGELRARRRPIAHRAFDLLIAATALTYDLLLVTRNRRDYDDISDLKLYEPS